MESSRTLQCENGRGEKDGGLRRNNKVFWKKGMVFSVRENYIYIYNHISYFLSTYYAPGVMSIALYVLSSH